MKALPGLLLLLCLAGLASARLHGADVEDNEFAEFEDVEDEEDEPEALETKDAFPDSNEDDADDAGSVVKDEEIEPEEEEELEDEVTVEDEDEFEYLHDEEEFEGYDGEKSASRGRQNNYQDIKIAKVPMHLQTSWESYYLEILMLLGLTVYLLNYLNGKSKNYKLATAWLQSHKELLSANFSIIGDDGQSEEAKSGTLMKESESVYALWCSGRQYCEGMLIELKLLKRQCLINVLSRIMKPAVDQIRVVVEMNADDMDSFVFAIASKKSANKLMKELTDINLYCADKRSAEKYSLPPSLSVISEMGEIVPALLDSKTSSCLNNFHYMFDYLHFSDQYTGIKLQADDSQTPPEPKKVLIFNFNVPGNGRSMPIDMVAMEPMMKLVLYYIDKVKKFRLSKEAKAKASRARSKVVETQLKASHAQRQEAAQERREKKRRAEKERLMDEEDPDKARKLEEREYRRDLKKKNPVKMKQMKVRVG